METETTADRNARWSMARIEVLEAENERLRKAVSEVYYAAHWTPDRPCDAVKLWTDLRDAAGLTPGNAPAAVNG
jgi:hypothetical protein